jgi:hypothetical protein
MTKPPRPSSVPNRNMKIKENSIINKNNEGIFVNPTVPKENNIIPLILNTSVKKELNMSKLSAEKEQKFKQNHTFHPEIHPLPSSTNRDYIWLKENRKQVFNRLTQSNIKRDAKIKEAVQDKEKKEMAQCTFTPAIIKKTSDLPFSLLTSQTLQNETNQSFFSEEKAKKYIVNSFLL